MHMQFTLCGDDIIEMGRAKWKSVRKGAFLGLCLMGLLLLAVQSTRLIHCNVVASMVCLSSLPLGSYLTYNGPSTQGASQ